MTVAAASAVWLLWLHVSALSWSLSCRWHENTKKALKFEVSITNNLFVFGGSETDRQCAARRHVRYIGLAGCRFIVQLTGAVCFVLCAVNRRTAQSHLNFPCFYPSVSVCSSNVFFYMKTRTLSPKCACPHVATHQRTLGKCRFPTPVLGSHLPSSFCLLQKVLPENLVSPYIHFSLRIVCSIQWFLMLRQGKVDPEERY